MCCTKSVLYFLLLFINVPSFQVTEDIYRLLQNNYDLVCRGDVSVKGKGQMLTYFLEGKAQDTGNRAPHHTGGLERRVHAIARTSNAQTKTDSTSSVTSGFVARVGISNTQGTHYAATYVPTVEGEETKEESKE